MNDRNCSLSSGVLISLLTPPSPRAVAPSNFGIIEATSSERSGKPKILDIMGHLFEFIHATYFNSFILFF